MTGSTHKGRDHATAAKHLAPALAKRPQATGADRGLRELLAAKDDVEYGTALIASAKAEPLVRQARTSADLAIEIVRLGR